MHTHNLKDSKPSVWSHPKLVSTSSSGRWDREKQITSVALTGPFSLNKEMFLMDSAVIIAFE